MSSLANKRIILGLSGGIAAYKSAELCRLLVKAGAQVRVSMTPSAREFITPLTMQALSGNRVHADLLDEEAEAAMGHIELARWADLVLIAPASANFIARLNQGAADDLLTTLCLATKAPVALAPAMNQGMWLNRSTQQNLLELGEKKISILGPDSGAQACGEVGPGRMLEPAELLSRVAEMFASGELAGLKATITAGPTQEALDPVRYLSNRSSGKMGYALAQAAVEAGALVTLVSGPVSLEPPERVNLIRVASAEEMLGACLGPGAGADIFIGVAAVADYRPVQAAESKMKKTANPLRLELEQTPDILATVAASPNRPFCVGFAAETEDLETYAKGKLRDKKLDLIFANDAVAAFDGDDSAATAYWADGKQELARASKTTLARAMIRLVGERMSAAGLLKRG